MWWIALPTLRTTGGRLVEVARCFLHVTTVNYLFVADINKFLWMVRIGGSTEKGQHIKEHDYYTPTGEFRIDRGGSQVLLNCLMYKMCYYRFGSVYTEQGEYFPPLSPQCEV